MIVIVIIGIFAVIAIPKFGDMSYSAKASSIVSNAHAIIQAFPMYLAKMVSILRILIWE
jgi:type II secretory pathway pseudopilin PulG